MMGLPGLLPSAESVGEYRERIWREQKTHYWDRVVDDIREPMKMLNEIINRRLERTRPISSWREYPRHNLARHIARLSG